MLFSSKKIPGDQIVAGDELVSVSLKTLLNLSRAAAGLALPHSPVQAGNGGNYLSRFKGRGMEFDETRLYQPGDDVRSIDWRVTARTGKPHTKIFREERERPVFISVDQRKTMKFATRGVFKSVLAAKLAGLLAWTSEQHGDRIGGQIFSDEACNELKPRNGKYGVLRFLNALVNAEADSLIHRFSLDHVLARLVQHARPGSLVYIISDFRGMNEAAETHLAKLSQHCDVVLIFIYDVLEKNLPEKGRYRFTDQMQDVVVDSRDERSAYAYRQRFAQRLQSMQQIAGKMGLTLVLCCTTDDPVQRLRYARNPDEAQYRKKNR